MGDTAPTPQYLPGTAVQTPAHRALVAPLTFPKVPAGQGAHEPPLPVPFAYVPGGHATPDAPVLPAVAQALPLPATHGPVHAVLEAPVLLPNRPAGHGVHDDAPPTLYWPAGQCPEHIDDTNPTAPPKVPGGHGAHG